MIDYIVFSYENAGENSKRTREQSCSQCRVLFSLLFSSKSAGKTGVFSCSPPFRGSPFRGASLEVGRFGWFGGDSGLVWQVR
jgi:hypothetical protein